MNIKTDLKALQIRENIYICMTQAINRDISIHTNCEDYN